MKTLKISTNDNRVINVNASELVEVIKIDGLDQIELSDKHGWDYIENKMMDAGFSWSNEETVSENIERFMPLYEAYINGETKEEEFGRLVNEAAE